MVYRFSKHKSLAVLQPCDLAGSQAVWIERDRGRIMHGVVVLLGTWLKHPLLACATVSYSGAIISVCRIFLPLLQEKK